MWNRIEPLMPADPVRGRRWADHRRTLEAIAWKYRTGTPWRDLPDELGSIPDRSQTVAQVGRGRHLGTDPRRAPGSGRRC
ncbi:transposase [Streptomyces rubrogriseus]|uniref:transposase n=1 Tax=Streptomyces rubrogriseus TaxID=194673 RepID=UPI0023B2C1E9|nr:transposase [Streptomyces rubrogriseus]